MAITPQQAAQMTQIQLDEVLFWEKKLDTVLEGCQIDEKRSFPMPERFTDAQYNNLKARYTAVGWNVNHEKQMTEGLLKDFWVFSVASNDEKRAADYYNK